MSINKAFRVHNGLTINSASADVALEVHSNDAIQIPVGNTGQRPTGANGHIRYNSESGNVEVRADSSWRNLAFETVPEFNYITNPTFRISQRFGETPITSQSAYVADEWVCEASPWAPLNTAVFGQRITVNIPGQTTTRYRCYSNSTVAVSNSTHYAMLQHRFDYVNNGFRSLAWGTANTCNVLVRFGVNAPQGEYSFFFRDWTGSGHTVSYVEPFTITAGESNTDVIKAFEVPGPTTGSWNFPASGTLLSGFWGITYHCGSTYQTSNTGNWISGNYVAHSTISNLFSSADRQIQIFDVGIYADPKGLGLAGLPRFKQPSIIEDERRCFYMFWGPQQPAGFGGGRNFASTGSQALLYLNTFPAYSFMRTDPGVANTTAFSLLNCTLDTFATSQYGCCTRGVSSARGSIRAASGQVFLNARH